MIRPELILVNFGVGNVFGRLEVDVVLFGLKSLRLLVEDFFFFTFLVFVQRVSLPLLRELNFQNGS